MSHPTPPRTASRVAGVLLILGVVLYIAPTALHGNPPIDDALATLTYVADRPGWRLAHFANIAAVVLWAVAAVVLAGRSERVSAAAVRTVWPVAAAVFAVYFGLHAVGLGAAADQHATHAAPAAAVVERTEALLLVLGSVAFVGQALLGAAVATLGAAMLRMPTWRTWFAGAAVVIGLGWLVGALATNFAIIVPFTAFGWVWMVVAGVALLTGRGPVAGEPQTS